MKKLILVSLLGIIFVSSFITAREFEVDENTVALWHMNENSGELIFDETQNDHDGTIRGPTWTNGKYDKALLFDGIDDSVVVPTLGNQEELSQLTLEGWIKRNSDDDGTVISRNGPYCLLIRGNKVEGGVYAGNPLEWTTARGETDIQIGKWYYIAMTYDGENIKVYVNGREDGSTPKTGRTPRISQILYLGWGEPGQNQFFNGIIDEVRVSNIARDIFTFLPKPIENKDRKKPDKIFRL